MSPSTHALNGFESTSSSSAQAAITASHAAYQCKGTGLRSMRSPKTSAPREMPPKKAATTASTAAASWPSQSALCCVHTSW